MIDSQSDETKTDDTKNSVSIEMNEESFKEKNNELQNSISEPVIKAYDYIITIKRSFLFKIKYFKFGKTIHFYLLCSLKENQYNPANIPFPYTPLQAYSRLPSYWAQSRLHGHKVLPWQMHTPE